jgi:hypothetical protein
MTTLTGEPINPDDFDDWDDVDSTTVDLPEDSYQPPADDVPEDGCQ